jgi:LemA protein
MSIRHRLRVELGLCAAPPAAFDGWAEAGETVFNRRAGAAAYDRISAVCVETARFRLNWSRGTFPASLEKDDSMFLTLSSPVRRARGLLAAVFATFVLSGCGYNTFQQLDEQVKAAWSEVLNQYQRRADLIPNIVATVKGEANFEQETLTKVIEARSRATSIQATPELVNDPEAFDKFQKAQGELTGALSRLMVVAEQYPNLKANQAFQDLRVQLEGTENRITVARNRYIKTVADYNVLARSFPSNLTAMVFGYKVKPSFTVQNEAQISVPPSVSFDKPASK